MLKREKKHFAVGILVFLLMCMFVLDLRLTAQAVDTGSITKDQPGEDEEVPLKPVAETLDTVPDMPKDAEGTTNIYEDGEGTFLSVVPAKQQMRRGQVPADLEVGEEIPYPVNLGNYSTNYFTVDGRIAYCLESAKATPPAMEYMADEFDGNELLQKVLYYGYGGPGDVTDIYMPTFDTKLRYLFTHLAAAYAYCGIDGFTGCTLTDIEECGVWGFVLYIQGLEAPPSSGITISSGKPAVSIEGNVQRTEEQWLQGDPRSSILLDLPENVTCHYNGDEVTGTVEIFGGSSFYFTAPWRQTGTWNTGELQNLLGDQWKAMVLSTGDGNQDVGYGDFSAEGNNKVSFSIEWQRLGKVVIFKQHEEFGGGALSGAVFELYADEECTQLIQRMPPTDEKGRTELIYPNNWMFVYVKEAVAPQGYRRKQEPVFLHMKTGDQTITICDEEQMGKLTVRKQGDVLTGVAEEDGMLQFRYELLPYSGIKYTVYAAEDIYSQNKITKYFDAGETVARLQTGADGSAVTLELPLGKYKVVERQAPEGLVLGETEDDWMKVIDLAYEDQDAEFAERMVLFTNRHPEITVNAVKKSKASGAALEGAVFGLYADSDITDRDGNLLVAGGTLIERAVSDADGNACFQSDIPIGFQYSVRETQAPTGYSLSDEVFTFAYEYKDDETYRYRFEHEFLNEEIRGEIHIKKIDRDSHDFRSQGDARIMGAEYGLYAAEDFETSDKKKGVIYQKGELVAQGKISDEGTLDFTDLYLGDYVVKEQSAPEGYLLDAAEYPVSLAYEGTDVKSVRKEITVKEEVKKQAFQLLKISEDGKQTEADMIEGAGFKIYLISGLKGVKNESLRPGDGDTFSAEDFVDYEFQEEDTALYYENGEEIRVPELFTDKNGYLKSPELPFGDYVVIESTVPDGLHPVKPFLVHISEDSRKPQAWRVFDDRPLEFLLKIVKKDAQTQAEVVDNSAGYKIYDMDAEKYVEMSVNYPKKEKISVFYTEKDGSLLTPEPLKSGTYRIEETYAPQDYVQQGFENTLSSDGRDVPLSEVVDGGGYQEAGEDAILVTVDSDTVCQVEEETGAITVLVEQKNNEAVGSLTLRKKGERLKTAEKGKTGLWNQIRNRAVSAANQIARLVTGEDSLEAASGYTFVYEETELEGAEFSVYAKDTIYTPDGQTDIDGNRNVRYAKDALVASVLTDENGTAVLNNLPIGNYYVVEESTKENHVLDREAKEFAITYNGQETAVDYVELELKNERQRISLEIVKQDSMTGKPIEGVTFGLYAGEEIIDAEGKTVVEKDVLIETGKTDETGKLIFQSDLPHGMYYAKELEKRPGYLDSEEVYYFDASYTKPEEKTLRISCEAVNAPTVTEFTKTDLADGRTLEGAKLQILKDGNVVEEWVSGNETCIVYALEPGDYELHESAAPKGYVAAEDVKFTVTETGETRKVEMGDERAMGRLIIHKIDSGSGEALEGVEFTLYEKATGEKAATLVTDKDGRAESEPLPIGEYEDGVWKESKVYVLKETEAKKGYQESEDEWDITFEYQDDKTPVIEVLKQIQNTKLADEAPPAEKNLPKEKPDTETSHTETPGTTPKTGDHFNWYLPLLGILSGGGCMLGAVIKKGKNKRGKHERK